MWLNRNPTDGRYRVSASRQQLIQADPTFDAMEHYARTAGAEVVSLRLTPHFGHDLDAMSQRLDENAALVYICNPNNPTGTLTPRADLELFIKRLPPNTQILIDEAYHHYAGESARYQSFIDRPVENERVIVTRTFSRYMVWPGSGLVTLWVHPRCCNSCGRMRPNRVSVAW